MNDTYPEPVDDVTYNHNSPTGINNFNNTCNKDQPISFVIEQSGLRSLVENPDPDDVLRAVRKFAELSSGKDEAWLGIAISEIKKILKEANVTGSNEILKSTLSLKKKNLGDQCDQSTFLADTEPWQDPVNGNELINEIIIIINRFLILPDQADTAIALWVLFAWTHDVFSFSPLLNIQSPTKRCGKTTVLKILSRLVPKPLVTSNISTAALFRSIEHFKPTLIVDEVDTFFKFNEEINGVLNASHERDGSFVLRVEGDNHQLKKFCVWCPKILAGIGRRKDTLEDRSITIEMRRKLLEDTVEKLRLNNDDSFEQIRQKAARWAKDNKNELFEKCPQLPDELNDRAADNWTPLVAIADFIGGSLPDRARRASLKLSENGTTSEDDALGIILLGDIKRYFDSKNTDRISSEVLCIYLNEMEGKPWPEYKNGQHISKNQIARLLKPFDIKPKSIRTDDGKTPKGYLSEQFKDAFSRYCPAEASQNATAATDLKNKESSKNKTATVQGELRFKKDDCVNINSGVAGVADSSLLYD